MGINYFLIWVVIRVIRITHNLIDVNWSFFLPNFETVDLSQMKPRIPLQ